MTADKFEVAAVDATAVHALRRAVLRDATPSDDVNLPGDDAATTRHLALRSEDGTVVATSTWTDSESPDRPGLPALQLRGMAVHPAFQRRRLGARLIDAGVALAQERGLAVVWANARDTAIDFYVALGFTVVGDGFLTADTRLPHHRIVRDL